MLISIQFKPVLVRTRPLNDLLRRDAQLIFMDDLGINDDGSGAAALLEIATSIMKYEGITNKVRFAWWGAEE